MKCFVQASARLWLCVDAPQAAVDRAGHAAGVAS